MTQETAEDGGPTAAGRPDPENPCSKFELVSRGAGTRLEPATSTLGKLFSGVGVCPVLHHFALLIPSGKRRGPVPLSPQF
jgi:hypothetical protein